MRDWREIMENSGIYDPARHQLTEWVYTFSNGSYIEFFSADNALKVRGPGRDILFINECNLIEYDTYRQLAIRTTRTIFLDYNPADEFHWIYDQLLPKKSTYFIKTTYKDNPYLNEIQIKEIESYQQDENFWRVYGEGERGFSEDIVFKNWEIGKVDGKNQVYGLDFGYNNPCALVELFDLDPFFGVRESFYQSHLTTPQIIELVKQNVPRHCTVYCDSAEPDRIREMQQAGINAQSADKVVKTGLLFLKTRQIKVDPASTNLIKELKSYKFVKNFSKDMIPVKLNDHAIDAMRYATTGMRQQPVQSLPMFFTTNGTRNRNRIEA